MKKVVHFYNQKSPIRSGSEKGYQWFCDVLISFVAIMVSFAVGGALKFVFSFLGEWAYSTGLMIAFFPVWLWIGYCQRRGLSIVDYLGFMAVVCVMVLAQIEVINWGLCLYSMLLTFIVVSIFMPICSAGIKLFGKV